MPMGQKSESGDNAFTLTPQEMAYTYVSEADILNMALFGKTAAQWRKENEVSFTTKKL
jgi:hypothetical protein